MSQEPIKRRLAAIVAADMVGYSRLVGLDETGTLARQKEVLNRVIRPRIAAHDGQLVKTTGDGFLAEFPSAVDALTCAVAIQAEMEEHEAGTAEDRQIVYRIGINVGEVIFDDGDIFGDGVNVAARLEALADPGGILVSDTVFRTVEDKLDLGFQDIGPQHVKNIAKPVHAYHVLTDPEDAGLLLDAPVPARRALKLAGAVVVLVALLVAVSGYFIRTPAPEPAPPDPEPLVLRLLILPFTAADPAASVYADAASENLWLTMSRLRGIEMVPRAAALTLRGIDPTPVQIAEQGAVTHILDGRVEVVDGQPTITSRLRSAEGDPVWEQTSATSAKLLLATLAGHKTSVTSALTTPLNATERAILEDPYTDNPQAFLDFTRATSLLHTYHWNNFPEALKLFEAAIAADPRFIAAHAGYAQINYDIWRAEWSNVRNTLRARQIAEEAADAALALAPNDPQALSAKVFIRIHMRRHDEALVLAQGAMFRNSAAPETRLTLGWALLAGGDPEKALAEFETYAETAARVTAFEAQLLAGAWIVLNQPKRALAVLDIVKDSEDNRLGRAVTASLALVRVGDTEAARAYMAGVLQGVPFANLQWWRHLMDFYRDPDVWAGLAADLRTAGLPNWPFAYDEGHAADRFGHDALAALYETGFTSINGVDELGGALTFRAYPDGRLEFANSYLSAKYEGTWRIKGDQVCNTFADLYKGREVCEQVYRDPRAPGRRIVQLTSFGLRRMGVSRSQDGPDR